MTTRLAPLVLPTRHTHPELWEPRAARHHHPAGPNPRRMNGGKGGGGGGLPLDANGFIERNGIYWPLQGTNAADPLQGGYGFGDPTDFVAGVSQTAHPGSDGNSGAYADADLGAPCVAPCAGVVLARLPWDGATQGEGNHLWCYLDDPRCVAPAWMHWDHLDDFQCEEGQRFEAGQLLAHCGKSGGWSAAHLHLELAKSQPASWWQWPYRWSLAQMEAAYYAPGWWFPATADKAGGMGDEVRTDTTPEEREAVRPYFEMYGIGANMDSALLKRFCLSYYRDETPGPLLSDEYPATAPDGSAVTRQDCTGRIGEAKAQADGTWWTGYVEVVKEGNG